jgi:hypothetical protein
MVETHSDGCSWGSVSGNRDRIWLRHSEDCSMVSVPGTRDMVRLRHTVRVVAWGVSLVLET